MNIITFGKHIFKKKNTRASTNTMSAINNRVIGKIF